MKVRVQRKGIEFTDYVYVSSIALMTISEYRKYKEFIPEVSVNKKTYWWWLRCPGKFNDLGTVVDFMGEILTDDVVVDEKDIFVRPIIYLDLDSNLRVGDKFKTKTKSWTMIHPFITICDDFIGTHCFNFSIDKGDNYYLSDIKDFIENWWETEEN